MDRNSHNRLYRDFSRVNQQNYLKLITTVTLAVCAGGIAWFGLSFQGKHQQTKEFQEAYDLLEEKEYSLAIAAYDRLLASNVGEDRFIWINRGYAFLGLNQYQNMLESCSTATRIDPNAALAWNCQGEALYYLEKTQDALKAFEQAISKNPQEAAFWLNKARVLSDLQEYDEAIAASEKAVKLTPKSQEYDKAIAFNLKGQNLLEIRQYQESLVAFEESLEYSPDYLLAQQGQGIALYELGNYQQAIVVFQKILQRNNLDKEQKAISLLYTGVSLCQTQKFNAAEQAFEEVLILTENSQSQEIAQKGCGIQ